MLLFVCCFLSYSCRNDDKNYKASIEAVRAIKSNPNDSTAWSDLISKFTKLDGNAAYTEFVLIELSHLTKAKVVTQDTINKIGGLSKNERDTVQWMYNTSFYSP